MPQTLRLGTRGSRLALVQANMVRDLLAARGAACILREVKTSGDRIQDRSLADSGGKGLFTKELEEALLRGDIDLAVHSMKDVPTALPAGLAIAALLPREDPRDALVSLKAASLEALAPGARVGTSSVRRAALVGRARPDLETVLLRGNVDTRLGKLDAGQFDAMLLAMAGLKRLGLAARATAALDAGQWLPALAQGAIGIEIREPDGATRAAVAELNHRDTEIALACERAFQAALDGTCRTPIGGLATVAGGKLSFRGEVLAPDGGGHADTRFEMPLGTDAVREAAAAGREAGLALKPRAKAWLAL
ncbi:MAG TPA: hydroxymethylbilane synthase [Rhizomicrobium sp.]|nr:hydroxymethylbilane synthase [Rhizomicrobium sp.]